jgi:hypothetical protein
MTLTYSRSQGLIAAAFLAPLGTILMVFYWGYLVKLFYSEELTELMVETSSLYAGHLAIALGAILATPDRRSKKPIALSSFFFAFGGALIWNLIVIVRVFIFVFDVTQDSTIDDIVSFYSKVPKNFGFLIDGAIAFFFVKGK